MIYNNSIIENILNHNNFEGSLVSLNDKMFRATRIKRFFKNNNEIETWKAWYKDGNLNVSAREYGDYQTPYNLAEKVCKILVHEGVNPSIVIEPTFGLGHFIISAINNFNNIKQIYGVEIQKSYAYEFKKKIINLSSELMNKNFSITVNNEDLFKHQIPSSLLETDDDLLILGNPPWVTVAELNKLSSSNIPKKSNIKGLNGIDAKLGKSNFDIAEYIIIKLLDTINSTGKGTLAMLCKNATAKNIIHSVKDSDWNITSIKLFNFDAKKEFNVATDASLFFAKIGEQNKVKTYTCDVYDINNPSTKLRSLGWVKNKFVSNIKEYVKASKIDNVSQLTWRSGVKHDSSKIMELSTDDEKYLINGLKEKLDIEDTFIYNLLKSSDLNKETIPNKTRKKVIITQSKVGQDTSFIKERSPKLWNYLSRHKEKLDKRGSSIYKKNPSFSIFGIGDYSFAPYKVAIAGMYKKSNFSLVMPIKQKTVMLDDTCNFLSFNKYKDALFTFLILNSELVQTFLKSITFMDSQRPYTIETLKRIDLLKSAKELKFNGVMKDIHKYDIHVPLTLSEDDYKDYINRLKDAPSSFLHETEDTNGLQELLS